MADRRYKLIGQGLPGPRSFGQRDLQNNDMPRWNATTERWELVSSASIQGVTDHGALSGLSDDDHPQYPLAASTETISGAWTFSANPTVTSGEIDIDRSASASAARIWVRNSEGGADLLADGDSFSIRLTDANKANPENAIVCAGDGAVSLYYDNSSKLRTTATGAAVSDGSAWTQATPVGALAIGGGSGVALNIEQFSNSAGSGLLAFKKSRSAALGTNTIAQNGDLLGEIGFYMANGTGYDNSIRIVGIVSGTPGASANAPGRLSVYVSPNGSATATRRFDIHPSDDFEFRDTAATLAARLRLLSTTPRFGIAATNSTSAGYEINTAGMAAQLASIVHTGGGGTGQFQLINLQNTSLTAFFCRDSGSTSREYFRGGTSGTAAALSFFAGTVAAKQTVTGSRGGNAALASLLTALANYGLITDSSSA